VCFVISFGIEPGTSLGMDDVPKGQKAKLETLRALLACIVNSVSLAIFLFMPGGRTWIDYACMIGFGVSIGALICYLGGLLAIDSVPKEAAGAGLGLVGIASYLGAGLQDLISGHLIEKFQSGSGLGARYDFTSVSLFWVGA